MQGGDIDIKGRPEAFESGRGGCLGSMTFTQLLKDLKDRPTFHYQFPFIKKETKIPQRMPSEGFKEIIIRTN